MIISFCCSQFLLFERADLLRRCFSGAVSVEWFWFFYRTHVGQTTADKFFVWFFIHLQHQLVVSNLITQKGDYCVFQPVILSIADRIIRDHEGPLPVDVDLVRATRPVFAVWRSPVLIRRTFFEIQRMVLGCTFCSLAITVSISRTALAPPKLMGYLGLYLTVWLPTSMI